MFSWQPPGSKNAMYTAKAGGVVAVPVVTEAGRLSLMNGARKRSRHGGNKVQCGRAGSLPAAPRLAMVGEQVVYPVEQSPNVASEVVLETAC